VLQNARGRPEGKPMNIDLHIHSKNGSDGRWDVTDIFAEAERQGIGFISITDHDSLAAQGLAIALAQSYRMKYVTGVELNVTFSHPDYRDGRGFPLDFLGYGFDIYHERLGRKLEKLRSYRILRALKIFDNLNREFLKAGIPELTERDMEAITESADESLARPHIAGYLVEKGIVRDKQEAFDRYLVQCDVPKMPLSLKDASELIRNAGGRLVLAHPGDPSGTSLMSVDPSIDHHLEVIRESMLPYIDGIECWHIRHREGIAEDYLSFARRHSLIVTGGSDCHQHPAIMGSLPIPGWVADQFP
jgi:3',5'-nucleoside bisphosphate phosphatase